ncbi:hypothetical protein M885DRAFT_626449, partial [Pelagophyceae sp. CCMP2097]
LEHLLFDGSNRQTGSASVLAALCGSAHAACPRTCATPSTVRAGPPRGSIATRTSVTHARRGTPATSTAPRRRRGLKRFTRDSPPLTLCCCPGILKRTATQRRPATRRLALTCRRRRAATFLPCSFCNLSYHNSAGCLGKVGGAI